MSVGGSDVTVIVPSYRRPVSLARILGELARQEPGGWSYDVLVLDDGSPEPLAGVVERAPIGRARGVHCLRQANAGVIAARNVAATQATGRFLLFLDDDMSFSATHVREHLDTQHAFGPGAVSALFTTQTVLEPEPLRRWYERRSGHWDTIRGAQLAPLAPGVHAAPGQLLSSGSLSIGKAEFESVGGFDVGYKTPGCEDMDLGLRLARRGIKVLRLDASPVWHLEPRATLRTLCERQRRGAAATVRFVQRFADECADAEIARVNGPLALADGPALMARKIAKSTVVLGPCREAAFGFIAQCERLGPRSRLLSRAYDLMVGAYIQAGWRLGLEQYGLAR